MHQLRNKRILVGITGGIAAYKTAELVRELSKLGTEVQVVLTEGAKAFVTPMTLQALSGRTVRDSLLDPSAEAGMGHIELARWADRVLIAPASADSMARMAAGMANDLLTTLCLATESKVLLAPAMNQAMWADPATQRNLDELQKVKGDKLKVLMPASGEQACGDVGAGRMQEVSDLLKALADEFETKALTGKKVVITAGPTREPIDPVRYISNHSSGKMGYALAQAAMEAGAQVELVSGPVNLPKPDRINNHSVVSAQDMYDKVHELIDGADIFIATAAVADFRPETEASNKLKKVPGQDTMTLTMVKNPDILASVSNLENNRPNTVVGFAAETDQPLVYGRSKLEKKNLDFVVVNDVSRTDIGFNADHNEVTLLSSVDEKPIGPMSKTKLAEELISEIVKSIK